MHFSAEHCNVVKKLITFLKDCTIQNKTVGVRTIKLLAESLVSTDVFLQFVIKFVILTSVS